MKMQFKHISFDTTSSKLTLKTELAWEKRLYSRDQQDIPDAQFADAQVAQNVLSEVAKVVTFYSSDLDVVIHKIYNSAFDDEHKHWLDELLDNRAEKVKDTLVEFGLVGEKVETRAEAIEEGVESEGLGVHFEIIREMRATSTAGRPRGPDHVLEVQGCGSPDFNGRFKPAGILNGETKYRHINGGKQTIAKGVDGVWYMCMNHDPKQGLYKSRDLSGPEPWKHCATTNTGLEPVVKWIQLHDGGSPNSKKDSMVSFNTR
jgi:hypothetical protein